MKRHSFIYFLFLCLVATSCENTAFEEGVQEEQAITRSTPEELGYYGSKFRNVYEYTSLYGPEKMTAQLEVYPSGSEYNCRLASAIESSGVRTKVMVSGATISYNGSVSNTFYGTNGSTDFTIKIYTSDPIVTLCFDNPSVLPTTGRNTARLVINTRKYEGENLPAVSGGFDDLTINSYYGGTPFEPAVKWLCNICGNRNEGSSAVCESCGRDKGTY